MLDAEAIALFEGGSALLVGSVGPGNEPHASRGYGVTILDGAGTRARVLVSADEPSTLDNLRENARVAVTATDVRNLRGIQVKGHVTGVDAPTPEDRDCARRYLDAFFAVVYETDGVERELLERVIPTDYVACTIAIDGSFDQTPGPGAGTRIERPA